MYLTTWRARKESTLHGMMMPRLIKDTRHLHPNNVCQVPAEPDPLLVEIYRVGLLPQFVDGDQIPNLLWRKRNIRLRHDNPDPHVEKKAHSNAVVQIGKSQHSSAFKKEGRTINRNYLCVTFLSVPLF